jgi:diguanylate cyclase (GGDEF)-like protein/PAS domain S-box-containing protein
MFNFIDKKRNSLDSFGYPSSDQASASNEPTDKTAITALKYSNELKGSILKSALDGIITINDKGEILEFNPSAQMIFGYSIDEVVGKNIAEIIIPPNLREQHRKGFNQFLKTGEKKIIGKLIEITAMRSCGEEFPVEMTLTEINLDNDRLFTAFVRDITERKRVESELKESEQRYRNIVEAEPECVKTITADGKLLNMNPAGLAFIEADSFEEVEGLCVYDLVIPEDRDVFIKMNERVFNGETVDLQFRIEGLKGTRRWMETHAVPVFETDSDSVVVGHLAVTRDITKRINNQNALIESEERFRSSFEYAPFGMGMADREGNILQVNDALCKFSGYSEGELLNKNFREFIHPDDIEQSVQNIRRVFAGEIDHYNQLRRFRHKKGHYIWGDVNVSAIKDAEGRPQYLINHLQDITERKKTEVALLRYNRALKVLNQCNDILVHAVEVNELLDQVCNVLVDTGGYRFTWVGFAQSNESKTILPMARAGYESGYLDSTISWEENEKYYCPITDAILSLEPKTIRNIKTESKNIPWRDAALERGYLSTIALPMKYNEQAFGVIVIYSSEQDVFDDDEIKLLANLADNIAYGIQSINNRYIKEITERSLRVSEQNYRTLFDENPCMFFTVDEEANVLAVNKFGAAELGYKPDDIIGRSFFSFTNEDQRFIVVGHLKRCLNNPDDIHRWEMQTSKKNGTRLWVRVLARVAAEQNNNNTILIVCEDITEARMLSDKLVHQATHDSLTGLINRHEFETRLHRVLNSAQVDHTEHVLCYLDLDQFKIINDTCGHMAGDGLLRQLSEIMRGHIRNRDSLARLGGDEFGVLIEHCSLNKAEHIADNLRQAIADFQFYWDDKVFRIGVSIGMVSINNGTTSMAELLMAADNACYTAKDKGRNRIHVHQEGDTELENRRNEMLWTTRIQKALEENRFCLAVQTIIPLNSKENNGEHYEILVRMVDEDGKLISPNLFIPVAERYNLITRIDRCVVDMTIDWLSNNPDFLGRLDLFSINLAGPSLVDDAFLEFIIQKLTESKVQAEKICFEITETAAIANLTSAGHFIARLKEQGCKFALDDFGSGLSSFAYLKTLPVDYLKIDGVFVRDIENEQSDLAIVKSIHEISRALNKKTIAEFVENDSILRILEKIGVDYAQGYGISLPQPLDDLIDIRKSDIA